MKDTFFLAQDGGSFYVIVCRIFNKDLSAAMKMFLAFM